MHKPIIFRDIIQLHFIKSTTRNPDGDTQPDNLPDNIKVVANYSNRFRSFAGVRFFFRVIHQRLISPSKRAQVRTPRRAKASLGCTELMKASASKRPHRYAMRWPCRIFEAANSCGCQVPRLADARLGLLTFRLFEAASLHPLFSRSR